jgi:hypothetical protein
MQKSMPSGSNAIRAAFAKLTLTPTYLHAVYAVVCHCVPACRSISERRLQSSAEDTECDTLQFRRSMLSLIRVCTDFERQQEQQYQQWQRWQQHLPQGGFTAAAAAPAAARAVTTVEFLLQYL